MSRDSSNNGKALLPLLALLLSVGAGTYVVTDGDLSKVADFFTPPASTSSSSGNNSGDGAGNSGNSGGDLGDDHLKGDATLSRVQLTGYRLENGTMVAFTDNSTVDFTNATSENLFGIRENETIVPGCEFVATMSLSNSKNIALDYWMEVRMPEEYFNLALAKQLEVTLTVNDVEYTTTVGDALGGERAPLGELGAGESVTFTVRVAFDENADNNAAQDQTVCFDLFVTTVQAD